ncbi:MAG: TadE/TadG family type IV pilus assembly protein [Desertimonas sp.]
MLATVIVLPAVLLAFWLVLQAAIVMHAQHLAQAAAQDAAAAGAIGGDPGATARALMAGSTSWVSNVGVGVSVGANEVTVRVSADALQIFPFGSYSVAASGAAPIEEFIPQPERL